MLSSKWIFLRIFNKCFHCQTVPVNLTFHPYCSAQQGACAVTIDLERGFTGLYQLLYLIYGERLPYDIYLHRLESRTSAVRQLPPRYLLRRQWQDHALGDEA